MIMLRLEAIDALKARRGYLLNRELAKAMDITEGHLSNILAGRIGKQGITLKTVERFCRALRCQPGDFLEYTADTPATP